MELKQLRYFTTVAELGSFSRAATQLSVVQPALSRQISRLEEEFGARLFYRHGRGVKLTPQGEQLLATARQVLDALAATKTAMAEEQGALTGEVIVAFPPSVDMLLGAALALRLNRECPGIRLHVTEGFSGYVAEWLMSGRIDLGVVHEAGVQPNMSVAPLLREPLYLVGQADTALGLDDRLQGQIAVSRLRDVPLITHGPTHGLSRLTERLASDSGLSFRSILQSDAFGSLRQLLRHPGYYSILPIGAVLDEIDAGRVQAWRLVEPEVINTMVLAVSPNRPFSPAVRRVREMLCEEAVKLSL